MAKQQKTNDSVYQPDFLAGRERLFNVAEAAAKIGLSQSRICELIRQGELAHVLKTGYNRRIYHIPESALQAYRKLREARRELRIAEKANQQQLKLAEQFRNSFRE